MEAERRRRNMAIAAVLVPLAILLVIGLVMAGSAGFLPWQPEPTRVAITPFANLPGTPVP